MVTSTSAIDATVKAAFAKLAQLRRVVDDKQAAETDLHGKLEALQSDQSRIRDNIGKIGPDSALYKRYLEKLTEQETQIEKLQAAIDHAAAETRAASASVDGFIAQIAI
jgi:chromosome segregation ATPase